MTQSEKDKIIAELQEKLAEAEKIEVEQPKRWKPNQNQAYWIVCGNVSVTNCRNTDFDNWNYLIGNCFKTEEEAEEYKKQIEYTARYKNYIEEHSEPIDWKNDKQEKCFAYFYCFQNGIEIASHFAEKGQGIIYASDEEIIWDAIKEIGEDNFKKYVLGVK